MTGGRPERSGRLFREDAGRCGRSPPIAWNRMPGRPESGQCVLRGSLSLAPQDEEGGGLQDRAMRLSPAPQPVADATHHPPHPEVRAPGDASASSGSEPRRTHFADAGL